VGSKAEMIEEKRVDLTKRPLLTVYYDCIYILQRTFRKRKLLGKAAIHESAHIVFTYFYGFGVRQSRLLSRSGNGFTETLYGSGKIAANIIFKGFFDLFETLETDQKKDVIRIAHYLLVILSAGSCAEAFIKRKPKYKKYKIEISGKDLDRIQIIEQFLRALAIPYERNTAVKRTFDFYEKYPVFRETTEAIAKKFLESDNYSLNTQQIENALNQVNFFNERDKIIDSSSN
jgi:hypothetical protein